MRIFLLAFTLPLIAQQAPPVSQQTPPASPTPQALSTSLQAQPADIDALLKTAREAYTKGDYAAAKKPLEDAWAGAQQLEPNDPKRYDVLKQLSGVSAASGDNMAAQNYLELAINWRETAIGRDDPKIADDLIELAALCLRQKNFDRALAIHQRVLSIHSRVNKSFENSDVADDFSRMALVYAASDKHPEAAQSLTTAIGIREKLVGVDSPQLLTELERLATEQITARFYEPAEITLRRAMVIRERLEGSNSPNLLTILDGLSYVLFGQKKYEEAEIFYKRLLNLWTLIGNQSMMSETLEKMAVFYRDWNKWDQGTDCANQAIALRALVSAAGLSTEATAWVAHGDKKHAIEIYNKALSVLDPNCKDHDGLREQIARVLDGLEATPAPAPAKQKPTGKATAKKQP